MLEEEVNGKPELKHKAMKSRSGDIGEKKERKVKKLGGKRVCGEGRMFEW